MAAFFSSSHLLLQFSFSPSLSFQNGSLKLRSNQFFPTNHSKFVNAFTAIGSFVAQLRTSATLRQLCEGHVPDHVLQRMEEIGFHTPAEVQQQGLPVLFSGCDCVLHAQTGSGKTLTYLLLVYSTINTQKASVQALIVVPTRELGMQVTKVARMLAAKPTDNGSEQQKSCTVMALLDGGMLKRHRMWLKADPPIIVVATVTSLCQMLEKHALDLGAMRVLVIDEVDFMFNSARQVSSLRKLLTSYSSCQSRQTVFASASIPQHRHFLHECVQQKWTKSNVVHVHVNPVEPMPARLHHRFMICSRNQKFQAILSLLQLDKPDSAILFVNEQSEKSKRAGDTPTTTLLIDFLKSSCEGFSDIALLEEDQNFNSRAASLLEVRKKRRYLLVSTDLAARGVDLAETTHIYNIDLPKSAVHYLHRAGRTGRKPFSEDKCFVTSLIVREEQFVLKRFQHELKFQCEELFL
ncbi:DEAD-box ATP-dependent RNA helicase 58, chloroplastic-like isoform X1 [Amaranthus tricolor]|uniref:DEAD-box ATP-dependent RNA helicase 58, chloroplastic-like isoform X1 n=3 Tax=Amaranthus tricolor TaxID=29722 RepID=UPI00258F49B0|nr:DEAD-box ATP-dependent RNA helicase 58, chloroplastic-like isoform X1 [Amaranthus tricolor]XP_057538817.1 DEAD-box ATP-dependent RNA helicase 58, chloroplastic-like isoform X1 [Amaranthus tricolor]XP_057547037.1 DEAD-box ATP-dependent RNA helicase 58, chloroplastic-like isoform X1 [Amaranthus tricolor]XP_057547105.1 DEAD-box ATP-dependent RNA helicase 58, chloroplastic-like isoform X1 [Amaranthus tricolor]